MVRDGLDAGDASQVRGKCGLMRETCLREMPININRQTDSDGRGQTKTRTDGDTDGRTKTDRQTDRQTDRRTDRRTDRQTDRFLERLEKSPRPS
jgi:hypothetical protein